MAFACSPGKRDCYVNAVFMIDLRARKKAAKRRALAREFARHHAGRLFTYERFIAREVRDRIELSNRHKILLVADCGDTKRMNQIFAEAYRLIAELSSMYELDENTRRDMEHVAAAIVLGARYYVTGDEKICRWINADHPSLFKGLKCINHRKGESCAGPDLEGETPDARENRGTRGNTLVRRGRKSPGSNERGRKDKGGLRARQDNEERGREKAKGARGKGRKRKREWEKSQKSKVARRAPRRGARKNNAAGSKGG